jgi:hypothetical protein
MDQPGSVAGEWRKSARCEAQNCVEVAQSGDSTAVRSSALPAERLAFAGPAWQAFVDGVRAGCFDLR